jgi:hypothetical protein
LPSRIRFGISDGDPDPADPPKSMRTRIRNTAQKNWICLIFIDSFGLFQQRYCPCIGLNITFELRILVFNCKMAKWKLTMYNSARNLLIFLYLVFNWNYENNVSKKIQLPTPVYFQATTVTEVRNLSWYFWTCYGGGGGGGNRFLSKNRAGRSHEIIILKQESTFHLLPSAAIHIVCMVKMCWSIEFSLLPHTAYDDDNSEVFNLTLHRCLQEPILQRNWFLTWTDFVESMPEAEFVNV